MSNIQQSMMWCTTASMCRQQKDARSFQKILTEAEKEELASLHIPEQLALHKQLCVQNSVPGPRDTVVNPDAGGSEAGTPTGAGSPQQAHMVCFSPLQSWPSCKKKRSARQPKRCYSERSPLKSMTNCPRHRSKVHSDSVV